MTAIDLSSDMGESFGSFSMGDDATLMQYISSANIAGGFHAGDPTTMRQTVGLAKKNNVALGIHPGYRDLVGFGRRALDVSPEEIRDELIYQLGALQAFANIYKMKIQHVKPHGALYMAAAKDEDLSRAIIEGIQSVDSSLYLYCMEASITYELARKMGQPAVREFYADRGYGDDGQIAFTRKVNEEMKPDEVGDRVVRAIAENKVQTVTGRELEIEAESVCLHSDTPGAAVLAEAVVRKLSESGVKIQAVSNAY
ncbi:MAG: LamB/YcsF family protein [Halothiobacillus sp.]|jgi:UPF0271 protein|nr:LamB/YcsF family protein [Halothiobacillus sp.]